MNGSILRASFGDTHLVTSKSRTSPAIRVVKPVVSKCVIGPMPERPLMTPSQLLARSLPSGETRPRPVTTTRRLDIRDSGCLVLQRRMAALGGPGQVMPGRVPENGRATCRDRDGVTCDYVNDQFTSTTDDS